MHYSYMRPVPEPPVVARSRVVLFAADPAGETENARGHSHGRRDDRGKQLRITTAGNATTPSRSRRHPAATGPRRPYDRIGRGPERNLRTSRSCSNLRLRTVFLA